MISLLVTGEKWLNCTTWRVWMTGGGTLDVACRILSQLFEYNTDSVNTLLQIFHRMCR